MRVGLTLDGTNVPRLAEFWKLALGYEDEPPPPPYATREEWLEQFDLPEDDGEGAWLHDPAGVNPRLSILEVPEPKTAKNRVHIDIRVSGEGDAEERWARIGAKVAVLSGAGATVLWEDPGHHVTMADPEGNEFCVC
ncbi:VOC family protein [Nonomuraea sp. LPB2021202275-12-8]|uniref:VOC family protein n=1 Tax=Nonomuraea sp. LPB2021202275-12-8 TaxID=3120159 RepID=UPI00300CCD54